jgi:hypothetical protein
MIPKEPGEAGFVDSTSGEFEDGLSGFCFRGGEMQAIAFQEDVAGHEPSSFVTVDEGMISHDPGNINGSQLGEIALRVSENLARAGQGGLKQSFIAQARRSTVCCEQNGVHGVDSSTSNPDGLVHFARTRSALR